MIYLFVFIITFTLFIFLLIYLRKFQYDKTHQVLLDLVEDIGGEVIRKSFAAQPIYRGKYQDQEVQITFSTDKINNKRVDYITLSYVISSKNQVTLLSKDWLNDMSIPIEDKESNSKEFDKFIIRVNNHADLSIITKELEEKIMGLYPFAHIVFSESGIMLEMLTTFIIQDIEKEKILNKLDNLAYIANKINRH